MTRHAQKTHKKCPICCCSPGQEKKVMGLGLGYRVIQLSFSTMLTMVGCGHHSEVDAGKRHVWKHVELPHPKPALPASVMLNLLSGWPRLHWQSGIRTAGKKRNEGHNERSFQCHSTSHLGSDRQVSRARTAFRSLRHKPGLRNIKHGISAEQPCLLQDETSQQLCRIPFTGQQFVLCNGVLPPCQ